MQLHIQLDATWSSTVPPVLRPFLSLATHLIPRASSKTRHFVFLSAFDESFGGVERYLAKRLAQGGAKVTIIDVPSGRTRRRKLSLESAIGRVVRDALASDEVASTLRNIRVLEPDPTVSLEHHLEELIGDAFPAVQGVLVFSRPSALIDRITEALPKAISANRNPWVIELDFSGLETGQARPKDADSAAMSNLGMATHTNPYLRVLNIRLPSEALLFGDASSSRNSFLASVTHAALGSRPISLPFSTRSLSASLGVHSDDVALAIIKAIEVMRKARNVGSLHGAAFTEIEIREPDNILDQWSFVNKVLDWTDSLSPVSRQPEADDPLPTSADLRQGKARKLLGNLTFTPFLDAAKKYTTVLLEDQKDFLSAQKETQCAPERLSPPANIRLREIQGAHGCLSQLLTLDKSGSWWTVGCRGDYPDDGVDQSFGSLLAAPAIPDAASAVLPAITVDIKRAFDSAGRKGDLLLKMQCPASSTRTHPPQWVGDGTSLATHGYWNASGDSSDNGWRDLDAWYPSPLEEGGKRFDSFVVDLAKGGPNEGFALRLPQATEKEMSTWLSVGATRKSPGGHFRPLDFHSSRRPATRFRLNPICCAKTAGGSSSSWAGLEKDPIAASQVYFNSPDAAKTKENSQLVVRQCEETTRALKRTSELLRRMESWPSPLEPSTFVPVTEDLDARPICPSSCEAPVACIASLKCRCTTDSCGTAQYKQPGWLYGQAVDFLLPDHQRIVPAIDLPIEDVVDSIPLESLILPFARASFFGRRLRPHVMAPSIVSTCSTPEGVGCKSVDSALTAHLNVLTTFATPAQHADFIWIPPPQPCPASAFHTVLACSLELLRVAQEHAQAQGDEALASLPVAFANGLSAQSRPGSSLQGHSKEASNFAAASLVWHVDGSLSTLFFVPERDIVIPATTLLSVLYDVLHSYANLSKMKTPPSSRRYLAFFMENVEEGYGAFARTRIGCGVPSGANDRKIILYNELGRHLPYHRTLDESTFCLLPRGMTGLTSKLGEVLYAGCIPVFVADSTLRPFHDVLDYSLFSIQIPELHLPRLNDILRSYNDAELQSLQAHGLRIRDYLLWKDVIEEDQAGPLDLALVATKMRIGGEGGGGPLLYRKPSA
ncbi:hypothetical protein P7C70_g288, partial [Phenoliferia sp. Uapishka_3]